ncbi:MAG: hypothetical protein RTU30_06925 [Candidatus Thorarchaeota archaeon]
MKPSSRPLMIILVALMVITLSIGNVEASPNDDALQVDITTATYLDLDDDSAEDDVITAFSIDVPTGDWDIGMTFIYCYLELPSGLAFDAFLMLRGDFSSVTVTLGWYNTAIESGWYYFGVYAWSLGSDVPDSGFSEIIFDPPTDGVPGDPVIHIINSTIIP